MSPTLSLPACCDSAGRAAISVPAARMAAAIAPTWRMDPIRFMTVSFFALPLPCGAARGCVPRNLRCHCAELEALNLACGGLRQLVDEFDPARIFPGSELGFDVLAKLLGQSVRAL